MLYLSFMKQLYDGPPRALQVDRGFAVRVFEEWEYKELFRFERDHLRRLYEALGGVEKVEHPHTLCGHV